MSEELTKLAGEINTLQTVVRMWMAQQKDSAERTDQAIRDICANCQMLMGESFRRIGKVEVRTAFIYGAVTSSIVLLVVGLFLRWLLK